MKSLSFYVWAVSGMAMAVTGCQQSCPLPQPCPVAEACNACAVEAAGQAVEKEDSTKKDEPMAEPVKKAEDAAPVGVKTRAQIDPKYLWKKDRLFVSHEAFSQALENAGAQSASIAECRVFDSAARLRECLDLYFRLHTDINKLTLYANMTVDTEPSDASRADQKKAANVLARFMEAATGVRDGILKIDPKVLDGFFASDEALRAYEPYIRNISRRVGRVLDADGERVLSLAGDNLWAEIDLNEIHSNSEDVFSAMIDALPLPVIRDEAGEEVQLNLANYSKFRRSPNREVRRAAVDGLMDALAKYEEIFANAYVGQLKNDVLFAKARRYDTALEAYLDKDNIPTEIYKNLIETVGNNLKPLHRYVTLRKKILGLDSVHLYDMYIPLTEGSSKTYTYDEAASLITTALAPLGEEYVSKLRKTLDPSSGSIDLLPHEGKTSGAYSCSVYGIEPFILMNYQDSLDDVSTLAHELGHSLHSLYAAENQNASSYHYTMFLAEIASTTNEALLNDYLLRHVDSDAEKINLLVDKLENIRATIYRQTLFAEFEWLAHTEIEQNRPIQAKWLNDTYAALIRKYYGPDYTMSGADDHEWAYIPHFYYKYYVYSYATGLSSALSFASLIEADPKNAVKYIDMLKGGSSRDSVSMLKDAGVDLTTPAPIEFALREFDETLTQLEALLNK